MDFCAENIGFKCLLKSFTINQTKNQTLKQTLNIQTQSNTNMCLTNKQYHSFGTLFWYKEAGQCCTATALKQTSTLCCKCKLCIVYCHLFVVLLLFFELVWLFLASLAFSICFFFAAFLLAFSVNFFVAAAVLFRFLASVFLTTTKEYHFKHTATK